MEEMRSFGYICPACGRAVLHSRSVFALNAAAARMECECGKEALTAETDGLRFRLQVPCGVCGGHHQAECAADAVLRGRGIGLACPEKHELCCYIGEDAEVRRAMEGLALRVAKEKASPDASLSLLGNFVGMLTDSRSFISYPRHEYFRRILCNYIGNLVENGEYPEDYDLLGEIVKNISYYNAVNYFGFDLK